ncbi:hypothetical protein FOZ62_018607, partial [Perkinsus olseni]
NKEDRSPEQDFYSPESLLREGKEAGHRQAALRLRSYEDSFRNSIGTMVQREADSLVDDALAEGLGECAKRRALQEARATARFVNPVLNAMEEEQHGQDAILNRLMEQLLWPHVERRRVEAGLALHQRRFAHAAQRTIEETVGCCRRREDTYCC